MAPGTAAPIRDPSRNDFKSPLKKAARRIVTAPTFNVIRTIDFDKKSEYEKFIQFIDSSNKELAKIKLKKPEIDKRLATVLPIYPPDMTVKGTSLLMTWLKRIHENWKKFVKWFKQSKYGKKIRNLMARWKNLQRKMKNLLKRIKSIKWKDLLNRVKDNKFIKGLTDWVKSPKKWPKLPKWPKDLLTKTKEAFDKFKQINWKQILEYAGWIKGIGNIILGKATPWGLVATTIINDVVNTSTSKYPDMQGPNAYFNNPSLQKHGPFKVEDVYSTIKLMQGIDLANDLEQLKALGMEADLLERYAKFLKEKNRMQKEYGSEYSNLNTKSSIDTELEELEEKWIMLRKEQNNIDEMINPQRRMPMLQDELIEILNKQSYLKWKKREFYNELNDNNQSNIQTNNNFDLSQIYSMDSTMFDSGYALLNNSPQLYVMESDGETKYVPFSVGASSNNSLSLYNEIDYSQFNSKLLDELRFIKLSGG